MTMFGIDLASPCSGVNALPLSHSCGILVVIYIIWKLLVNIRSRVRSQLETPYNFNVFVALAFFYFILLEVKVNLLWKNIFSINWRDVKKKHVANNVYRVRFRGTMPKWPVQETTTRQQHKTRKITRHNIHSQSTVVSFVCFLISSIFVHYFNF